MDFLDGSDVDEDNVADVDQDVENVLLGSDDEEAHSSHQPSKFSTSSFSNRRGASNEGGHRSDEEDDVLNIVLQGEEEQLDFDTEDVGRRQVSTVKLRNSMLADDGEPSHLGDENVPTVSNYDGDGNEENFQNRRYVEEDDYDDDDTETRTRSRFTSERNVESFSGGHSHAHAGHSGHASTSSNSVGIPIQTVGERKVRPGAPDIRPKHWNGPRHPGRNHHHRFPHGGRPPMMDNPHMRPNMHQPILQFNDGIFTDFNQPMRHPRPRQPLPGRLEPRNLDHLNPSHQMHPQNAGGGGNRPPMPPQNIRPFYPPNGPQQNIHPPRMHTPGVNVPGPHPPPPRQQLRPDFNPRQQRPRFPPNNVNINMNQNQRNALAPPPHMNQMPGMPHPLERPPFQPRHPRPPFRPEMSPHNQGGGMQSPRHPNAVPGFHPPPHNIPQNYPPPQPFPPQQGNQPPPRMGMPQPQGTPPDNAANPFFVQAPAQPNFNPQHRPDPAYQPDMRWGGIPEQMPAQMHNSGGWMQHPNQPQQQQHLPQQQHQNYAPPAAAYGGNVMYDHSQQAAVAPIMHHNMAMTSMATHPQMSVMHTPHQLEVPPPAPITKSIYIKPNSEIHEALSKGHFLHTKSESRHHESSHSSKHYDEHYHHDRDRERGSSRRTTSPSSSDRRRDDDDYYHHHDRRSRRKYDEGRRHRSRSRSRSRSPSPERKYSRSERPSERDRDRDRERDRRRDRDRDDSDHKESGKLMEEAKKMGLGEDYVKKLEEQRRLREKILRTKEQRRKQVKVAGGEVDNAPTDKDSKSVKRTVSNTNVVGTVSKGGSDSAKDFEADSTVATSKGGGKPKKILRIVRDKNGKIISKKVHVVLVATQQEGQQQSSVT